jgi:hypothetical protein
MDVISLQNGAIHIGLVGRARAETLERRFFVAEGFKEGEREGFRIERGFGELGDRFFDFDCIHSWLPLGL